MKTAEVVTQDHPGIWVQRAICDGLRQAGLTARPVASLPEGCPFGVRPELVHLWVEQDPGFWTVGAITDIRFKVTIVRNGQVRKAALVQGRGDSRSLLGTASTKQESLKKAMGACLEKGVPLILDELP
jgi:hypothetical protein